jgi:hypothetical protein
MLVERSPSDGWILGLRIILDKDHEYCRSFLLPLTSDLAPMNSLRCQAYAHRLLR